MGIRPTNVSFIDQMCRLSDWWDPTGDGETCKLPYGIGCAPENVSGSHFAVDHT